MTNKQRIEHRNARKLVSTSIELNKPLFKIAFIIVTGNLLLVLVTTLFPFNFSFNDGWSVQGILDRFNSTTYLSDQLLNVLLFIPLGFGFTCLLPTKKLGAIAKLTTVLFISAGLSFTVEVLQAFLPSRNPTLSDIITNTAGGLFGCLCFFIWKSKIFSYASSLIERSKGRLSVQYLTVAFIGYIALSFLISIPLQSTTKLSNWDSNFPLLLGNERTADRPWRGYVSEVYIADRAMSQEEVARAFSDKRFFATIGDSLLADYELTGKESYPDQTGHLPDLSWRGQPLEAQDGTGVFLTSSHWLETVAPVTFMSERIRETSEFTLSTTVATADTTQTGPARIVSLSNNPYRRNFTLGQEGSDLVFRLRTPITGQNGAYLKQLVPDIFADTNLHHLIITYSGSVLQIYIDKLQNSHSLNLLESTPKIDKFLYYGLIFIPLGSLLALITTLSYRRFKLYIFFLYSGILLPSLILEGILASESGRSISLENLLLGILITAGTILMFKVRATYRLRKLMM